MKAVLFPTILAQEGKRRLARRPDIRCVEFDARISSCELGQLLRQVPEASALVIGTTPVDADHLHCCKELRVISRIGVGVDGLDIEALTRRGIAVTIVPHSNDLSVAEHVLGIMLLHAKRFQRMDQLVRDGRWHERYERLPTDLSGRSIFIIGLGRIGKRVARIASAIGMKVWIFDPERPAGDIISHGEAVLALDDGLREADFITLHCPLNSQTKGLLSAQRLALLKRTAYLINTARGALVDEAALHRLLVEESIGGAALDVFSAEPPDLSGEIRRLPNVTLSPHLSGVTMESVQRMGLGAALNVLDVLDGEIDPSRVVNTEVLQHPFHAPAHPSPLP